MATIARTTRMTADEFFANPDVPEGAELVDGVVVVPSWGDAAGDGMTPFAPDLAVEVLSPSERHVAVRKKLADYFGAGARLVWLVDPEDRVVEVHASDGTTRQVGEAGLVDGGDVLPGFMLPVADVFAGVPREG